MSTKKEAPPSYESLEASEMETQLPLAVNTEYSSSNEQSPEADRLRNLLLCCLTIDYGVHCPDPVHVSAVDHKHYLQMCDVLHSNAKFAEAGSLEADDRNPFSTYIEKYLHKPCDALGLPDCAVAMVILCYAQFMDHATGLYQGCVDDVIHTNGMEHLARKISVDRAILFPRITTCPDLLRELDRKSLEVARPWIIRCRGIHHRTTYGSKAPEPEGWPPFEYVLTERGELHRILDGSLGWQHGECGDVMQLRIAASRCQRIGLVGLETLVTTRDARWRSYAWIEIEHWVTAR